MVVLLLNSCGTTERSSQESERTESITRIDVDREIQQAEQISADIPLSLLLERFNISNLKAPDSTGVKENSSPPPDSLIRVTIDRQTTTTETRRDQSEQRTKTETEKQETIERTSPFSGLRTGMFIALLLGIAGYLAYRFGLDALPWR